MNWKILVRAADDDDKALAIDRLELDGARIDYSLERVPDQEERSSVMTFRMESGEKSGVEKHRLDIFMDKEAGNPLSIPITLLVK